MHQFLKSKQSSFFYISSILILSILFLFLYNLKGNKSKSNLDPGFQSAVSIKNDKNICLGDINNLSCFENLIQEMRIYSNNILFLGNSQTGAINNFKEGDQSYISLLNNIFTKTENETGLKGIWLPNATIGEFNLIYNSLKKCKLNINFLIIPVFLDDTRIDTIREEVAALKNDLCEFRTNKETFEKSGNLRKLNNELQNKIKILNSLESLNSKLRIDLYKLRNSVFNIKPSSKRNIKTAAYKKNLNYLNNILIDRKSEKLKTLIYIPPLLNASEKEEIPYEWIEYRNFKNQIEDLCSNYVNCNFYNFESIVPNSLWGFKESTSFSKNNFKEIDFMHFTFKGHEILANNFLKIFINNKFIK